jgi:two-component system OmpR family response regulator
MQPVRVLVVDDETTLAELLSMALRYEGWEVRSAGDGRGALRLAREFQPDAVVLDIMLPDMDGLEVLRRLRAETPDVPVLFLTARDAVEDRVAGLTAGGDDYVTKPFSLEELVARLRGLMRRAARTTEALQGARLAVGDLTMDEESREVARGGVPVHLTATEFELLRFFMRNPRRVLSKAQILDRVWNYDFGGQANVVELYVSYLRKKIDAGRPPMIHTMRGAGYVLRPAETEYPARPEGASSSPAPGTTRDGAFGWAGGSAVVSPGSTGAGLDGPTGSAASAASSAASASAAASRPRADYGSAAQFAPRGAEAARPDQSRPGGGLRRARRS